MNDHQDSENFSYEREWKEIYDLLHEADCRELSTHCAGHSVTITCHARRYLETERATENKWL